MPCRVMVIDDSELDLLYARIVLERLAEPVEVLAFDSARDALQSLQSAPVLPRLILLDINMPGMNGFDFLAAYDRHAAAGGATAPVAMLTSSPDSQDRDRAFAHAAVCDYLVKPIDPGIAQALLQRLPA
jgi:CheY-like chemotaxis protein